MIYRSCQIITFACCCLFFGMMVACKHSDSNKISPAQLQRLSNKAAALKAFIQQSPIFHPSIVFLVDMRQPSGQYRFFVYDIQHQKVLHQGLATHGSGSILPRTDSLVFKNIPDSYATSLGRYKMGYSYIGDFGKAYKMYGIDASNSKAFERFIVYHAHECVPAFPVDKDICLSMGCPTVNPAFFDTTAHILDTAQKPIIMEIFY